ncbi:TatD family hydrolase [Flavihumibacter sp. CACIAM 22H1]|uniref:TatD family hydrolase n=1 Tax=Flavihumibacter sp. CACIAM 22H1 TaxID=1812911 RepID=UPI0007A8E2A6|nr:TatD family hydrolase [Flavihumibacter sp. CACIAM 22H1]KYP16641.1 MAG: hydrolase TatD [Flavihumibacter sp. CACIAM 22H1]
MTLIDTHCHLYVEEFQKDTAQVLSAARQAGVERIYLPAIDSAEHLALLGLEAAHPGTCIAMMGLHPCYVKDNYEEELRKVEDWFAQRKFAAVGEIGLDFYWDRSYDAQQYEAFRRQLELARHYKVPVSIHSRNATLECIKEVKALQDGNLTGVFHCFSGSYELAKEVVKLGFYLGIGGVVTYKNGGLPEVLAQIPLEQLVLETDAPYLSPVPYRGKRNQPAYLVPIAEKLSDIYGVSAAEIGAITTANANRLFQWQP